MAEPIVNPELPFVGEVPSGLQPGKMIRFQGVTHPNSDRFNINFATGPNAKPRDDTALHISVRLNQGYIARNTYKDGSWGDEQGSGRLPIGQAQHFEMIVLVDPQHYNIAVNGQHFCEFPHIIPYQQVTHLLLDGDVSITLISFEGIALTGNISATQASQVNAEGPQGGPQFGGPQYGPPPGAYGAPPPNYGGYGPAPPPGAEPQSEFGGFLEKAQDILAGAIKSGAAEKLLGGILNSSGQPQQQQQGYAPQNAKYGIYPDLPTEDTTKLPSQNQGSSQDFALSNLIAGSGGTVTTGPQPTDQGGRNALPQQTSGPLEGLLSSLLSGNKEQGGNQGSVGPGQTQNVQSGGSDILTGLLSSLLSTNNQNSQPGASSTPQTVTNPQPAGQGTSDMLAGILQNLLSGNKDNVQNPNAPPSQGLSNTQTGQNLPPFNAQNSPHAANSGDYSNQGGSDILSGILSSLSPNQNQMTSPNVNQPQQNTNQQQAQSGDALSKILQSLISGSKEQPKSQSGPPQNVPNQPSDPHNSGQNTEMLTNLLQGILRKASEQHDNTRPIQETHPIGGTSAPGSAQNPQQQYGQYPHPPQQEQRGPMESLLSGLLSGGGQQQQPRGPQVGGEGSIGGLGSMGGILGNLAGSFLHKNDNQGH